MVNITQTALSGVVVAETTPFTDHRGAFACLFDECDFAPVLGRRRIVQINHSRTCMVGASRGMHFQYPPHAEMKLVRCLRGRVWDVAVDPRAGSSTAISLFRLPYFFTNSRTTHCRPFN